MSLSVKEQLRWWGLAGAAFVLILYLLGGSLAPFILGAAIAYLLDPIADRLEASGLSRVAATVVITLCVVVLFLLSLALLVPVIAEQGQNLVANAPEYMRMLQERITERYPSLVNEGTPLKTALDDAIAGLRENGTALVSKALTSSLALVNSVLVLVVSPVVAFYLLLDWDEMIAEIDSWLPREHAPVIRELAGKIDAVLAGFVRGQLTVALILGTFYAVSLTLLGLQFGVLIGMVAGIFTFIPFIGALLGGILSVGLGLVQFWGSWGIIAAIAAVFAVGQVIEGNVLTPKLVGESVGLHPVWLMFSLTAFGALFGFAGLLVAVPVAASLGVISRFLLGRYLESRLYRGPRE